MISTSWEATVAIISIWPMVSTFLFCDFDNIWYRVGETDIVMWMQVIPFTRAWRSNQRWSRSPAVQTIEKWNEIISLIVVGNFHEKCDCAMETYLRLGDRLWLYWWPGCKCFPSPPVRLSIDCRREPTSCNSNIYRFVICNELTYSFTQKIVFLFVARSKLSQTMNRSSNYKRHQISSQLYIF